MATTITKPATAPVIHRARGHWQSIDFRDQSGTGDGTNTFTGTAAVTGEITTLYEGRGWEWREQIAPDAFLACLAEIRTGGATYPVVLTHEHDNRAVMASTAVAGNLPYGLELAETPEGLRVFARLDPTDMDVQRIAPKLRAGAERLTTIPGTVPSPGGLPAGCRFAPRCAVARPECGAESPALELIQPGRWVRCPFAEV